MDNRVPAAEELHSISRRFGPAAARRKLRLLEALLDTPPRGKRRLRSLADAVNFIRAYPDDARVLEQARRLAWRLPGADTVHAYSYGVIVQLLRIPPAGLEIAWDYLEDESALLEALKQVMLPGEAEVMSDPYIPLSDWLKAARPPWAGTDLEHVVGLLERSSLSPGVKVSLFDRCYLPIRYRGPGAHQIQFPVRRVRYQIRELVRARFPLPPIIRRPLDRVRRQGQGLIDLCLQALCPRNLEIYPLTYANTNDVVRVACGRGVEVIFVGVLPEWRGALESLYFFLILKNGVPIAYGPAGVIGGCCEMGINLFPEFRGGEIRYIYSQFMRALRHRLGVEYFYLTSYGMGEDNEAALRSGAFWFYRKLGFSPTNPAVEQLARAEEARMTAKPGYRSDRRVLRRLSRTEAFLDLSGGRRALVDIGRVALAESRFIAQTFNGDRALAEQRCAARMARLLGLNRGSRALRSLAPTLCLIDDLPRWSRRDQVALAAFVRAKDARSETVAARRLARHACFLHALRKIQSAR